MDVAHSLTDEQFENLDPHIKFSPSRLDKHKDCAMRGHYEYGLRLDGGLGRTASQALSLGNIVHRFLELLYKEGLQPAVSWPIIEKEYPSYEQKMLAMSALTLMTRYANIYKNDPHEFTVIAVEKRITVPYTTPAGNQVYLDGRLDMVTEDEFGRLTVWDHKTDSRNRWSTEAVYFNLQLTMYLAMLYLCDLMPEKVCINQIYTGIKDPGRVAVEAKEKLFNRYVDLPSPSKIEQQLRLIGTRIDRIIEQEPIMETGSRCCFCPFKQACQLSLEGKDNTLYLESNFTVKGEKTFEISVDLSDYEEFA